MEPCDDACNVAAKGLTNWPKGSQIMGTLVTKMPLNNTKNELNATSILAEHISDTYEGKTQNGVDSQWFCWPRWPRVTNRVTM